MPLANCYPDDGSIEFIEDIDVYAGHVQDSLAIPVNLAGALFALPAYLAEDDILDVEFQYDVRSWLDIDGPPAWPADITRVPWSWPGPTLASRVLSDPPDPGSNYSTQLRWRLAWQPAAISTSTSFPNPWNFVNLRWREATWDALGSVDPDSPSSVTSELFTKHWQLAIDDYPEDYDVGDPLTWPGTDWRETPVPTPAVDVAQTLWYPRWPQLWTFDPSGLVEPALTLVPLRGHPPQGLIPGGRRFTDGYDHPRRSTKTVLG